MKDKKTNNGFMEELAAMHGTQVSYNSTRFSRVIRLDINTARDNHHEGFRILKTDIKLDQKKYKTAAPVLAKRIFELLTEDTRGVEELSSIYDEVSKGPGITDDIRANLKTEVFNFMSSGLDTSIDEPTAIIIRSNIEYLKFVSVPMKFNSPEERRFFHILRLAAPSSQCALIPRDNDVEIHGDTKRNYKISLSMLMGFLNNKKDTDCGNQTFSLHTNPVDIEMELSILAKAYEINKSKGDCGPPWSPTCKPD